MVVFPEPVGPITRIIMKNEKLRPGHVVCIASKTAFIFCRFFALRFSYSAQ